MRKRGLFDRLLLYLLWPLFAVLLNMGLFQILTDTTREKKLTLMINAPEVKETELMRALTPKLPEGISMIKARAFSYAMFSENSLKEADIWIVKESDIQSFLPDFGPVSSFREQHPELSYWVSEDGSVWGIRIYDASAGLGCLTEYVSFRAEEDPEEDYYLFMNPASPHTGSRDLAAFWLAEEILKTIRESVKPGVRCYYYAGYWKPEVFNRLREIVTEQMPENLPC